MREESLRILERKRNRQVCLLSTSAGVVVSTPDASPMLCLFSLPPAEDAFISPLFSVHS